MTFEASSPCRAPAYSPVSAAGSCNVEYPELGPEVKEPVLLMSREDLYLIVSALVVSKTGCTHALTYYFASDSVPKRNADETRQYISASCGVARVVPARKSDGSSRRPLTSDGCRICDALSLTVNVKDLLAARYEVMLDFGMQHAADGSRSDVSSVGQSDALPVVARMGASEPATGALHSFDASGVDAVKTCKANGGVPSCAFVLANTYHPGLAQYPSGSPKLQAAYIEAHARNPSSKRSKSTPTLLATCMSGVAL